MTEDTDANVLKKKKGFQKFFSCDLKKKGLQKNFSGEKGLQNFVFRRSLLETKRSLQNFRKVSGVFQRNFNGSRIVLSTSRGQGNFRGLEASRPRTSKCVLEDSTSDCNTSKEQEHPSISKRLIC